MKKTILITGGTGYIGSHTVVAFQQAGYKTVIVDNLSNSSLKTLEGIKNILGYDVDFFELDLLDKTGLESIFQKYSFDGVLHFAGLKAVGESCAKPLEYFNNNITGSLLLFETIQKYGVKNIIFSSSATVYKNPPIPSPFPLQEKGDIVGLTEINPVGECSNPYGTTKFLLENILSDLSKFAGFRVVNLRYFNPIGAHKSGFIGENPKGTPNNLLPFIMKVATGELKEVGVFGNDYNTVDGTGVRDYIDVVDLVEGHLKGYELFSNPSPTLPLSLMEGSKSGFFEVFNLGTGKGVSVLEMINSVEKVVGKNISYKILPRRAGDLAEVFCNPTKALNVLGWNANISLEDSLINAWKFYNK